MADNPTTLGTLACTAIKPRIDPKCDVDTVQGAEKAVRPKTRIALGTKDHRDQLAGCA